MIVAWIVVGAFTVFLPLLAFGKYLEKHPEKSAVGRSMEKHYSDTTREKLDETIAQVYTEAYEDGIKAMRECMGQPDLPAEPDSRVDLDDLQPDTRDPSERWADIDN